MTQTNTTAANPAPLYVEIDAPSGEFVEGRIIAGELEDGAWDLDSPFTVLDDEDECIRVRQPWDCLISVVEAGQ